MIRRLTFSIALGTAVLPGGNTNPVSAQEVPYGGNFSRWLDGIRKEAKTHGVPNRIISRALNGIRPDPKGLAQDRR